MKGKAGASVIQGLDLLAKKWPDGLRNFTYLESRTLSIPLKSGVSLENRSPESLVCQLVLCHSNISFDKPEVLFSDNVSLEPPYDLQRRFVAVLSGKVSATLFKHVGHRTMSIEEVGNLDHAADILHGLSLLATSQMAAIRVCSEMRKQMEKDDPTQDQRTNRKNF